jgi:hypothetical protein
VPRPPPAAHRWKKGQSGNPGGLPKDLPGLRALARGHTAEAIETLAKIMMGRYPAAARVQAANALLDRGYGRPQQYVEADLHIDAVRVTAGAEFDAKIIEAVARLGRKPDGSPLLLEENLETRTLEPVVSDDDPDELEDLGSFREMMQELKEGREPSARAKPTPQQRRDPLDGFRDPPSTLEPS